MDKEYDVLIVGAGTAGAQCARTLAKNGIKVLMLEKEKEIGEPNFSTAGTPEETLKVFNLPQEVAPYYWNKLSIESPNEKYLKSLEKNCGYVFDFRKLRSWLAEDVAKSGGNIAVGVTATDPILENGSIVGVKYQGILSSGEIRARIIVDATGNAAFLTNKLGLLNPKTRLSAVGLELEMTNVTFPSESTLYFYLGDKYIPNGYGWIFPLREKVAKVGIGRFVYDTPFDMKLGLKHFIEKITWLKDAQPFEFHSGSLSFDQGIKNFVKDNFITIGTAASHVNPLGGEGIRHGLYSGQFAAETIIEALAQNDTSEKSLQKFNKKWMEYSDNNWETCRKLARYFYGDTNNQKVDDYVASIGPLSGDDWFDLLFNYNFKKKALKILTDLAQEKVEDMFKPDN